MNPTRALLLLVAALLALGSWKEPDFQRKREAAPVKEDVVVEDDFQMEIIHGARVKHLISESGISESLADNIVTIVEQEASNLGLRTNRILAIILTESNCRPLAVSKAGAVGLMQIMPSTGRFISRQLGLKWEGVPKLYDVGTNIRLGVWYYAHLLRYFGGEEKAALAAYNWGPGEIRKRKRRGRRLPTRYVDKVYAAEDRLRKAMWYEYEIHIWGSRSGGEPEAGE